MTPLFARTGQILAVWLCGVPVLGRCEPTVAERWSSPPPWVEDRAAWWRSVREVAVATGAEIGPLTRAEAREYVEANGLRAECDHARTRRIASWVDGFSRPEGA